MNNILKKLSSLTIMVFGLFWLFVLTFWGTVAQTDIGLYAAQERYFYSWFFQVGLIPFPGARLVLWVLFINLLAATITRFSQYRKKRYYGLVIIHLGLLLYFVGAFVTFHAMKESNVHLLEKAGTNLASSYTDWEISFWPKDNKEMRAVTAVDVNHLAVDKTVEVMPLGLNVTPHQIFKNAMGIKKTGAKTRYQSAEGITHLQAMPLSVQHEENIAAIMLNISKNKEITDYVLLSGAEQKPYEITIDNKPYFVQLRRKKYPLPFTVFLDDFRAEFHPGTEMARSYESDVIIHIGDVQRKALISMNEPFRYKDYTLFQAAYAIDELGREYSTFAVVENKGRLLPYISSLLVFAGLLIHFITMAFTRKKYI